MSLTLDMTQFDQALKEYTAASRRDWQYILNKQIGNVAARASGFAPTGNKSDIESLERKPWWPKFVRKAINVSGGAAIKFRRKARGAELTSSYRDKSTGRMVYGRKRVTGHRMVFSKGASNADLRRISKAIIRARKATWKSIRAAFGVAALKFGVPLGKFERPKRLFALPHQVATPESLTAGFVLPFVNTKSLWPGGRRPSPSADVAAKERMAGVAAQRAVDFVATDMHNWAQPRLQKTANQYSGRR